MHNYNEVILSFDLDFTLIDNREGIINSFKYALKKYDIPLIDNKEIEKMIGTPLDSMFARISDLEPSLLTSPFREYYGSEGIYQVKIFPGVIGLLEELKEKKFILGVITSKKEEMAVKLLKNLKIANYFEFILGETENIRSKTDPKLKELLFDNYPAHSFVIVGDHLNDRALAEMLECPFIGVLTGFHSAEQLKKDAKTNIKILNSVREITPKMIYSLV